MDVETVTAKVAEQIETVRASAMCGVFGWQLDLDGLTVYVVLRPRRRPEPSFLLRVMFDDFPRRAPSYVFVNPTTRAPDDASWPPDVRHGSGPPGICTPGTREFHEHIHRDDRGYVWAPNNNALLITLTEIHRMVEKGLGA